MKSSISSSFDKAQKQNGQLSSSSLNNKQIKPPLIAKAAQQSQKTEIIKQKLDNSSQLQDKNLQQSQIKDLIRPQSSSSSLIRRQNSEVSTKKISAQHLDTSVDTNKAQMSIISAITATSQLSMLKKSSASVYGSEAGQKAVTKNPWASQKPEGGNMNIPSKNLQRSKSNRIQSQQLPQSTKNIVKDIQNLSNANSLKSKANQNLSNSQTIQLQTRKIVNQGINFGSFHSISQRYIENSYKEITPKEREDDELCTLKKISNISQQLQINQRRKVQQEMKMLSLQYELFLGEESLKDKIKLITQLNQYLQNSFSLNEQYDNIIEQRQESGNYVRINFEGRQIFLDIVKSQTLHSNKFEENSTERQNIETSTKAKTEIKINPPNKNIQRAEQCLWNAPQNIFQLDNQIDQIEKIDSLIQYMENSTEDLYRKYNDLLVKQNYL